MSMQFISCPNGAAFRLAPGVLPAAILAFAACESSDTAPGLMTADSAGVQIVTSDPLGSDAACSLSEEPVFAVGEEGGDESFLFSEVIGLGRLSDGSVAAIDRRSNEIRIFADDGRHLRSMGGSGEGPGEFSNAWFLWVLPGDTLWVGDWRPWRYNVFTSAGDFVKAVPMTPAYPNSSQWGGVLDNGVSVNVRNGGPLEPSFVIPDTLIVEAHDTDGRLVSTIARVPDVAHGMTGKSKALGINLVLRPLFAARAMADAAGTTVATGHGGSPEVRLLDGAFQLRRIVRWSDSGREVTPADVRAWRDNYSESRGGRNSDRWSQFDDVRVDPEIPAADFFPAFTYIMLGRDGRLWVLPYQRPGQNRRGFMAFQPDGTFLCHLTQPPSFNVLEFGADYALGVEVDELGVQTVAMYQLGHP